MRKHKIRNRNENSSFTEFNQKRRGKAGGWSRAGSNPATRPNDHFTTTPYGPSEAKNNSHSKKHGQRCTIHNPQRLPQANIKWTKKTYMETHHTKTTESAPKDPIRQRPSDRQKLSHRHTTPISQTQRNTTSQGKG